MKPLATTHQLMTWLSMCPADEPTDFRQKCRHLAYTWTILIMNLISFASSLTYFFEFITIDFNTSTFAFMIAMAEYGLIYFIIAAVLMSHRIGSIFTSLATIYKKYENEEAFRYLAAANGTSEWMWSIYWKYTAFSLGSMAVNSVLSVLSGLMAQGDFDTENLYRPDQFVFPWNQKTPMGYFAEIITSILVSYGFFVANGTPLLFFISICMHHQAFSKMIEHQINKAKQCDAKLLSDLIRFHVSAKDWFTESANVYNPFVLVQLLCNMIILTISVFYLDLQWQDFDFIVASVIIATSVGMSTLLFYCYFGQLATESYDKMPDLIYNMRWYEQPIKLQKWFVLVVENMQKPVCYNAFEVATLDLQTFIKLFRKVFSFYIAIKAIATK